MFKVYNKCPELAPKYIDEIRKYFNNSVQGTWTLRISWRPFDFVLICMYCYYFSVLYCTYLYIYICDRLREKGPFDAKL